jgi:predicted Zn-dependent peptidase
MLVLVVAGDFENETQHQLIEKYFGLIEPFDQIINLKLLIQNLLKIF